MAEYIEREKLLSDVDAAMENEGIGYVIGQTMKRYIKRVPAANVAPVRHGKWLEWFPGDCALIMTGEEMLYRCSSCDAKYSDAEGYKYCPNCGAVMEDADA